MPTLRAQPTLVCERPPQAQVTAVRFVLREVETGAEAGTAVVSPEARYASVAWPGEARLARLRVVPAAWKAVMAELSALAVGETVLTTSTMHRLVADDRGVRLTCETIETVTTPPFELAGVLDAILRGAAVPQTSIPQPRVALTADH